MGSKTLCNDFIDNVKDKLSVLDIEIDDECAEQIQFMYHRLLEGISSEVVNASSDPDRSDILVFVVIMSILLGDSRDVILNKWLTSIDLDSETLDRFKASMELVGYQWIKRNNVNIDTEYLDTAQRRVASEYYEIIKSKGTIGAIKNIIKYFNLNPNYSNTYISNINVTETVSDDSYLWSNGLTLESPYTHLEVRPQTEVPSPVKDSLVNAYVQIIKDKLEAVRPAGVFLRFPTYHFSLHNFEGGSYWRHLYNGVIEPYNSIKDSRLVKDSNGNVYLFVEENGSMVTLNSNYKQLICSRFIQAEPRDMYDFNLVGYSNVKETNFEDGEYTNAVYSDQPGGSMFYYSNGDLIKLKDTVVGDLYRHKPYVGNLEIRREH